MAKNEKLRLTNSRIKALANASGVREWVYDADDRNLAVSVSPKGLKTFYAIVWQSGKTVRHRLGAFPEMTVDDARREAKGRSGDAARRKDATASLERIGKDENRTIGDLFAFWLETHARLKKRTWERDEKEYRRLIKPVLHHIPITDVTRADIEKLVASVIGNFGKGPARKARSLLSAMLERAVEHDWIPKNPVRGTYRPDFDPRQRYIKPDEIGAFLAAVDRLESEIARDFFLMCLWTGGRRSNVASMKWDEIDFSGEIWSIPSSKHKSKRTQTVPLSAPAMEILKHRFENRTNEWVFPGRGKSGHYSDPKDAWNRVKLLSGIQNIRIHDLRRSLGAWQNRAGDNIKLISSTLGHSNIAVTSTFYTPQELEPIRESVNRVAESMLSRKLDSEKASD